MAVRNSGDSDIFKQVVKSLCKVNNISLQKPKFAIIGNNVVISVKNHLKDGVDFECFKILNLIYQVISPLGVKFNQQLYLYPNSERVARVTVSFEKEEYETLNLKIKEKLGM